MNEIDKMTDNEKSVLLARAMGWKLNDNVVYDVFDEFNLNVEYETLYDTANMSLAWRVLNWAEENHLTYKDDMISRRYVLPMLDLFKLPPAAAQRLWLDKILELAIEAGLVEREEEKE